MWVELWSALALVLVIEGILPFLSPQTWRALMLQMARLDDRALRMAGLASMLAGVLLLMIVR